MIFPPDRGFMCRAVPQDGTLIATLLEKAKSVPDHTSRPQDLFRKRKAPV